MRLLFFQKTAALLANPTFKSLKTHVNYKYAKFCSLTNWQRFIVNQTRFHMISPVTKAKTQEYQRTSYCTTATNITLYFQTQFKKAHMRCAQARGDQACASCNLRRSESQRRSEARASDAPQPRLRRSEARASQHFAVVLRDY